MKPSSNAIHPLDGVGSAPVPNTASGHMSGVASVTFEFDGTEKEFKRLYEAIAPIDLDIAAYSKGTSGVIEFLIDDFKTFKQKVPKNQPSWVCS
jgi:hypothetical protein